MNLREKYITTSPKFLCDYVIRSVRLQTLHPYTPLSVYMDIGALLHILSLTLPGIVRTRQQSYANPQLGIIPTSAK